MSEINYKNEVSEIERRIAQKRKAEIERLDEKLNKEKQDIIEALNKWWTFKFGILPPVGDKKTPLFQDDFETVDPSTNTTNGSEKELNSSTSRNDKLRDIVRSYARGDEVTSKIVFESFESQYPELAPGLADKKSIISKVLRDLEEKGELKIIKKSSGGGEETIYQKI